MPVLLRILPDPHAIAVAVKTVAGFDGVLVGAQDEFAAGEGADEDEQRRLRQMEIGDELIDDAKRVTGFHENAGFGGAWIDQRF